MKEIEKDRVVTDSDVIFGKPRIKGTRFAVEQILSCLSQGWSEEKIVEEFGIKSEDICGAIEYSNNLLRRVKVV